jgi:hypothetical protein
MGNASANAPNHGTAQPPVNSIANMNTNMDMKNTNAGGNNMATEGVPSGADIYIEGCV